LHWKRDGYKLNYGSEPLPLLFLLTFGRKMQKYVSLLRGINVSGQKKITMAALRDMYRQIGLEQVQSYIQSGNVLFTSGISDIDELQMRIESAIKDRFGFTVDVILRTSDAIGALSLENPFLRQDGIDLKKLHVTFFNQRVSKDVSAPLDTRHFVPDGFSLTATHAFVFCPNGYGRTKINNLFFEKNLKVKCTTRNWNTITKLVSLFDDLQE